MSLDDICVLYSFPPPKFDGPTFDPLPATDFGTPFLDPYARQRRPSLLSAIPTFTPPKEETDTPFIAQFMEPKRLNTPATVIPYGNLTDQGGDVHDTFKLDRYGNSYGGHTSVKIPAYTPIKVPWED